MMDLQSVLSRVVQWHKDSQYEPIVQLLQIILELPKNSKEDIDSPATSPKELAAQQTKASLNTYFGDSLFQLRYYRRAIRAYEQTLSLNDGGSRRASKRCKTISSTASNCDINKINYNYINSSENEIRYRIHLSHLKLHEIKEAKIALEKIPIQDRKVKVLASLADLYCLEKNIDKAKETFLEIIRQDPLRLDFVLKLCKLGGCDSSTILNLIPDEIKKSFSWYTNWIQAQCYLHSPNSRQATRLFEALVTRFGRKAHLLTSLAEAHYHDGNFRSAIRVFEFAYKSDPLTIAGVDSYAACLHKESLKRTLEDLAVIMCSKCSVEGEYFHEPWLVLAHYYASVDKKEPKALLFVQKAYKLNRYSTEALILLACLCLEKKDSTKAIPYIVTAQTQAPYRYEVQRILCDAFLANNKKTTALNFAKAATKSLGETARSYYLWADIMLKSQDQRRKNSIRVCLEKAVKLDFKYLPAVFAFTEILMDEKKYDKAIGILDAALPYHSANLEIHKLLYTCYSETKDNDRALFHQSLATEFRVPFRSNVESYSKDSQESIISHEEVDRLLGLEADELVEQGDSEQEDSNYD